MTVYISAIEIKNYRNFSHLNLKSFPRGAVVVGENGSGKSNLLRALRLVLDPSLPDSARRLHESDIWRGALEQSGPVEVLVSVELMGFENDVDAKSVLSHCVLPGTPYRAKLTYRFAPNLSSSSDDTANDELTLDDYDFEIFGGNDRGQDASRVKRDIGLQVLDALRDAETDLSSWRRNPLRQLLESTPLDEENLKKTAASMAKSADQLRQDNAIPELEKSISERLAVLAGSRIPITPSLGFVSSAPHELVRSIRMFIDDDRRHPIADASLGSANVLYLALLLELLERQRESLGHVETLLAVEEPEAHLHVALQRRLFRSLLRSGSAPILTTHSPHIASVTPVKSLVLLRGTPGGSVGTTTAELDLSEAEAADIERYLDVSRAEVLFASFVILVEGISELYVLPALAEACGFDLDGHGVVVASIHGTDFAPYAKLLGPNGLDIPFAIITDGDAAPDGNNRTEAGLRRAIKLIDPDDSALLARVTSLSQSPRAAREAARAELIKVAQENDIYVGQQTLETDIAELFPAEIVAAHSELTDTQNAKNEVADGLLNETSADPDLEIRKSYLKRIGALGKGRFAQRLASHLETRDLDALVPMQTLPDGSQSYDYGKADYLFAALDQAAMTVRGGVRLRTSSDF